MISLFHDLLFFFGRALAYAYQLIPNYGMAIILVTVGVRLVMLPLTIKQTRSMQEMQKLQPELKKLQAKYKGGDRQKLNEEMMKLYKEHQVNPLGGCLPLLLQLPIFFALYRVFEGCLVKVSRGKLTHIGHLVAPVYRVCPTNFVGVRYLPAGSGLRQAITAGHSAFLGIDLGLSPIQALHKVGLGQAWPDYVLIFLMVLTTWYQQKQIMAVSTGQQAAQMQMMGKIMPLILGVFSLNLPAGVSIYWVASNVWTIVQQRFILGKTAVTSATDAAVAPAVPAEGSGVRAKGKPEPKAAARQAALESKSIKKAPRNSAPPKVGAEDLDSRNVSGVDAGELSDAVLATEGAATDGSNEKAVPAPAAVPPKAGAGAAGNGKAPRTRSAVGPNRGNSTDAKSPAKAEAKPANSAKGASEQKSPPRPASGGPRPGAPARPQSQRGGSNARKKRK